MLVIWVISGGICYSLAKGKEKNQGLAFGMGFLFGFWAILYYAFCKEGGIPCGFCKKLISKEASICPYCQKEIHKLKVV